LPLPVSVGSGPQIDDIATAPAAAARGTVTDHLDAIVWPAAAHLLEPLLGVAPLPLALCGGRALGVKLAARVADLLDGNLERIARRGGGRDGVRDRQLRALNLEREGLGFLAKPECLPFCALGRRDVGLDRAAERRC
jgi:hypothetical protein